MKTDGLGNSKHQSGTDDILRLRAEFRHNEPHDPLHGFKC